MEGTAAKRWVLQVDAIVVENYTLEVGAATSRKFLRYFWQNTHFHASFIALAHVLPRLQRNPWGDGPKIDTIL